MSARESLNWITTQLWGGLEGQACLGLGHGGYMNDAGKYTFERMEHRFFAWPARAEEFVDSALSCNGSDGYFIPALRTEPSAKKGTAGRSRWAWVDCDGWGDGQEAAYRQLARQGAFRVSSGSPGHQHVYVKLRSPVAPDVLEALNAALAALLGGDSKWAENALLRLPGTLNHKGRARGEESTPVTLDAAPGATAAAMAAKGWTTQELMDLVPADRRLRAAQPARRVQIDSAKLPERLSPVVRKIMVEPVEAGTDCSARTAALVSAAVRSGLSDPEVLAVVSEHAPSQAHALKVRPHDPDGALLADVERLLGKYRPEAEPLPEPPPEDGTREWIPPAEEPARPVKLFHDWSMAELMAQPDTFSWTVRGLIVASTYGVMGGAKKTLKSYVSTFLDLALATGTPLFGHFQVDAPGAVIAYVGEGGQAPWKRRVRRIAEAMGVDSAPDLLRPRFEVAPFTSETFQATLHRDLERYRPALVHVDPYYTFHGPSKSGGANLFEEAAILNSVSEPCVAAGASFMLINHFNKTGSGSGLDRITQAGGQEWSDSWWLLSHREDPDVEGGRFRLLLEVGSRQWGGSSWELDLDVGRFDPDRGEYDGAITWDLRRAGRGGDADTARVLAQVEAYPGDLTKEELAKKAGGQLTRMRQVVDSLERQGLLRTALTERKTSRGQTRTVWTYSLVVPASDDGDGASADERI